MLAINIRKRVHGSQGEMELRVNIGVKRGEFVALMGESGAGKTTLLRILAGLESSEGEIIVDHISWSGVSIQKRNIGFVFQDYALFEHMSVEENLLFVNHDRGFSCELLELTSLTALKNRPVTELSGGQKQRVALCRAMMQKPKILLLDEPLSALDTEMKYQIQKTIKSLHQRFGMTTIMVSHDRETLFGLVDRVWVLEQGRIVRDGSLREIFDYDDALQWVKVLEIERYHTKTIAIVLVLGQRLKVAVPPETKIEQSIKISLSAQLFSAG